MAAHQSRVTASLQIIGIRKNGHEEVSDGGSKNIGPDAYLHFQLTHCVFFAADLSAVKDRTSVPKMELSKMGSSSSRSSFETIGHSSSSSRGPSQNPEDARREQERQDEQLARRLMMEEMASLSLAGRTSGNPRGTIPYDVASPLPLVWLCKYVFASRDARGPTPM
eukprot:s1937_g8.t1